MVVAKTLVAQGKKERALIALKKKRLHSQQLDWLDKLVLNVEESVRWALLVGCGGGLAGEACRHE